jgi:choice-of-anchor A domain-containing protein
MRYNCLSLLVLGAAAVLAAPLGAQTLTPYDVFVFQNFTLSNTEVNGRVAVGGNANLSSWAVGKSLPGGYSDFGLTVGGSLTTNGGSVYHGGTYVGGTQSIGGTSFAVAPVGGASPVDFAAEAARLTGVSDSYASMAATGNTILQWSQLNFVGTSMFNVFSVSIAMLQAGTGGYEFDTPTGATNIINVTGTSSSSVFNYTGFLFDCTGISNPGSCQSGSNDGTPADAARTLWNFNQQTSLLFLGAVHGSILAPNADIRLANGDVVGTVVAKSATSSSEFYSNHDFVDNTTTFAPQTTTPEPATLGLLAIGLGIIGVVRRRR